MSQRIIIEADGGSRGNPGLAAYGALLRDPSTGTIVAERAAAIGVATNNVAEYEGLIAGLELARQHVPDAALEVRMDSRLVIEQMAGRWKIKHPQLQLLAGRARELLGAEVQWTWIPREANRDADALVNRALDAPDAPSLDAPAPSSDSDSPSRNPLIGWRGRLHGDPMTLILLRHGVTASTVNKLFCGSGGADPGLIAEGEAQADRAAAHLQDLGSIDALVASPLRRTQETAGFVSRRLGLPISEEPGLAEAAFGEWDGSSFLEIMQRWPDELDAWLNSTSVAPPGGESFDQVSARAEAALDSLAQRYAGQTVVAVSHVTPIKMLVRRALDAPMHVIHRMELAPASLTTIAWWPDGTPSLRSFSHVP